VAIGRATKGSAITTASRFTRHTSAAKPTVNSWTLANARSRHILIGIAALKKNPTKENKNQDPIYKVQVMGVIIDLDTSEYSHNVIVITTLSV
jgi:hypothetical protein